MEKHIKFYIINMIYYMLHLYICYMLIYDVCSLFLFSIHVHLNHIKNMYIVYVQIHNENLKNKHEQNRYQLEDSLEMEERKGVDTGLLWEVLK